MSKTHMERFAGIALIFVLSGCAARFPPRGVVADSTGRQRAADLLRASIDAHGGYLYGHDGPAEVRVDYEGRWGNLVRLLQPVLVDAAFRQGSEERLEPASDRLTQLHRGPAGEKRVVRDADSVEVLYNGDEVLSPGKRDAAALVADAYQMFLAGPSFFERRRAELTLLEPKRREGRRYERLLARLRPGLGHADEDEVVLWIDGETRRLDRLDFTLNGLESTRGALVSVTLDDHRRVGGWLWPTRFVERLRAPLRVTAHRWRATSLEVDPVERAAR